MACSVQYRCVSSSGPAGGWGTTEARAAAGLLPTSGVRLVEIVNRVGVDFVMGRCHTTPHHTMPHFFRQLGLKPLCDGSFLHWWYWVSPWLVAVRLLWYCWDEMVVRDTVGRYGGCVVFLHDHSRRETFGVTLRKVRVSFSGRGVEVECCLSPGLRVPSTPKLGGISIECGKGKFPYRGQR